MYKSFEEMEVRNSNHVDSVRARLAEIQAETVEKVMKSEKEK